MRAYPCPYLIFDVAERRSRSPRLPANRANRAPFQITPHFTEEMVGVSVLTTHIRWQTCRRMVAVSIMRRDSMDDGMINLVIIKRSSIGSV